MAMNPPTVRETWVQSLGWEDLLEEGIATPSSVLPRESPGTEEPEGYNPQSHKELDTAE